MASDGIATRAAHGTGEVSSDLVPLQGIAAEVGFAWLLVNAPNGDLAAKKLLLRPTGVGPVKSQCKSAVGGNPSRQGNDLQGDPRLP